jgi:hypothetical protein
MRRIFQHKYIVRILAVMALCLALFSLSRPEIKSYNSETREKQIELRVQANGPPDRVYKFDADWGGYTWHPTYYAEIAFSLILFFSLIFSKRIFFSFLFAFLFIFNFIVIYNFYSSTVRFPDSYFRNYSLLALIFVSCIVALSYWLSSIIYHFCLQKFQHKSNLK